MKKLFAAAAGFFALLTGILPGQGVRSFSNSDWMTLPPKGEASPKPSPASSPASLFPAPALLLVPEAALQERVIVLRATIEELTHSLALANAEAETFKRQTEELTLKIDALGLAGLDSNPESIEQKLVTSVRDLRQEQARSLELENALLGLSESVISLLQQTEEVHPEVRLDLETRLRQTNDLLGLNPTAADAPAVESSLTNALVVDSRPQLALVILNVGRTHGVRIGTPFRLLRGDSLIGQALVVDVRERISGAIVQNLTQEDNNVRTGDRAIVVTQQ